MATSIKTRILLPRGTVNSLSARSFVEGELVLVRAGSKGYKPVEISSAGTGLTGAGAAGYMELELSALQIKLSSDVSLQEAYDSIAARLNSLSTYAQIKAQLSADGYALKTDITTEINKLSVTDTAQTNKFVTAVSESNGKISVTRAQPTIANVDGLQTALDAKNKVQVAQTFDGALAQTDLSVIKVTDAGLAAYSAALAAGTLNPNALYVLDLSATNALGQKVENVAAGTADSDAATYGQLTSAIDNLDIGDYAKTTYVNSVSAALSGDYVDKINAVDNKLTGYYLKTETSSATELTTAFNNATGALTAYVEKSALSIAYDSNAKKIYLSGGTNVSEINASDFIKDGMLSDAFYDTTTKNLVLVFNTESGASDISVDIGDLVDTYTASNTSTIDMSVSENTFSASIINGSITPALLSATAEWVFDCNL